jgi:GT2 family glycosyltransferase
MTGHYRPVSIIISAYNEEQALERCLVSLRGQDYPGESTEIIVVDNDSTDATSDVARRHNVTCIFEKKRNRARARNKGIREASGEIICIIDAHTVAEPRWLSRLVEGFDTPGTGACGGTVLAYRPSTCVERYFNDRIDSAPSFEKYLSETPFFMFGVSTANIAYSRAALEKTGLFDETLRYCSDVDLSWRICLADFQVKYVPGAVVSHKYTGSLYGFCRTFFNYGFHMLHVARKNNCTAPSSLLESTGLFCREAWSLAASGAGKYLGNNRGPGKIFFFLDLLRIVSTVCGSGLAALGGSIYPGTRRPGQSGRVHWTADNETVISELGAGHHYHLNETGTLIWNLLRENKAAEDIAGVLAGEFDISPETARRDVDEFIASIHDERLL